MILKVLRLNNSWINAIGETKKSETNRCRSRSLRLHLGLPAEQMKIQPLPFCDNSLVLAMSFPLGHMRSQSAAWSPTLKNNESNWLFSEEDIESRG